MDGEQADTQVVYDVLTGRGRGTLGHPEMSQNW